MAEVAYLYPDPELGLPSNYYLVEESGVEIGRHPDSGLLLTIDSISRRHARLRKVGGDWILEDLGSSNGTLVNGDRIEEPRRVSDGDIITLGKAPFTFRVQAVDEAVGGEEHSSGFRLAADEDDSSVILSTRVSDQTPFVAPGIGDERAEEHLGRINQRLLALYKLSDVLRGASRRDSIITALIDLVFENLPADRGVVLNRDEITEELKPELFRFREGVDNQEFVLSRTITRRALTERVAVLSRDVRMDKRFQASESIMASDIRSAMCVPLAGKRSLMGLLFLDSREALHSFTEDDLAFVSALATDAAMTLENLALVEENIRQERLAAVGQTISGLAHNIKNILQLARGGTELMDAAIKKESLEEISALWPITRRSIDRMQSLTQEMLDFSRQAKPDLQPTDVNDLLQHLAEMIESDKRGQAINVKLSLGDDCGRPSIDGDGLIKALMNLLSNAFDALAGREGAEIRIESSHQNGHCVVRVQDNGPGIPPEVLPRVFQPFFSTKGSKGNGLGLSMTRKYLEDMGAHMDLRSAPGQGCEFIVTLPSE